MAETRPCDPCGEEVLDSERVAVLTEGEERWRHPVCAGQLRAAEQSGQAAPPAEELADLVRTLRAADVAERARREQEAADRRAARDAELDGLEDDERDAKRKEWETCDCPPVIL